MRNMYSTALCALCLMVELVCQTQATPFVSIDAKEVGTTLNDKQCTSAHYVVLNDEDALAQLSQDDFEVVVAELPKFAHVYGDTQDEYKLKELNVEIVRRLPCMPLSKDPSILSRGSQEDYHTRPELDAEFRALEAQFPGRARVFDMMEEYGLPSTIDGNTILAMKISDNVDIDEDEPNYLVVSNHHAREIITPEIALDIARHLLQDYDTDEEIREIVDEHQTYVIWTLNPDGLDHVWNVDNNWRKNRRNNNDGTFGVDLNRNYPLMWNSSCGGDDNTGGQVYRGPAPASEIETQVMLAFHEDRHFAKNFDFHSSGRDIRANYPDCGGSLPARHVELFQAVGAELAARMNYVQRPSCCMAGNIDIAYHSQGSFSYLAETGNEFQPPAAEMRAEVARVWPGALWFLSDRSLPISISGHVLAADTGLPLAAEFSIPEIENDFSLNERLAYSDATFGRYHVWLPAGAYTFVIEAPGRPTFSERVDIPVQGGVVRDFLLP